MLKFLLSKLRSMALPENYSHPLNNNLQSPYSGPWQSSEACPHCRNDVSGREWSACICESCGSSVSGVLSWRKAASRQVDWRGKWATQKRIDGVNYLRQPDGSWRQPEDGQ